MHSVFPPSDGQRANLTNGERKAISPLVRAARLLKRNPDPIILAGIIFLGAILRTWMAATERINMDEGVYLNDARFILQGKVPFRDFLTREPFVMYGVAFFVKLFGLGLVQARMFMVCAGLFAIVVTYAIGRYFFNRAVGYIAAVIYAVSPFAVYQGSIVKLEIMESALVGASLLLVAVAINRQSKKTIVAAGFTLGLAIMFKRSGVFFVPVEALLLTFSARSLFPIKALLLWCVGLSLPLLPILYFLLLTDFGWIWNTLGWGEVIPPPWDLYTKARIVFSAFTMLLYCLAAVPLFFSLALSRTMVERLGQMVATLGCIAVLFFVAVGSTSRGIGAGIIPLPQESHDFFIALLIGSFAVSLFMTYFQLNVKERRPFGYLLISSYFLIYVIFFIRYTNIFVDYFMELALPLALMLAVSLYALGSYWLRDGSNHNLSIWSPRRLSHALPFAVFSMCVVVAVVFAAVFVYSPLNPHTYVSETNGTQNNFLERSWSLEEAEEVVTFVKGKTTPGDFVYTADLIFSALADTNPPHENSYPHHYLLTSADKPISYDPYNLEPPVSEIIRRMEERNVQVVVEGWLTRAMFQAHPNLGQYVNAFYVPIATFGLPQLPNHVVVYERSVNQLAGIGPAEPVTISSSDELLRLRGSWIDDQEGRIVSSSGESARGLAIADIGSIGQPAIIEVDVAVQGEGGLFFGYEDAKNYYMVRLISSPDFTGYHIVKIVDAQETVVGPSVAWAFQRGQMYHLRIILLRRTISVQIEEERRIGARLADTDPDLDGEAGLLANYGAVFSDLRISNDANEITNLIIES